MIYNSLLHIACVTGNLELVKYLLSFNVFNLNLCNKI